MDKSFDFLVIGGGSGGVRAARKASSLGFKVALFEKAKLGGTCVLKGCIPKKLMIYGSSLPDQIKIAKDYAWEVSSFTLDWKLQKKRREQELSRLSSIYTQLLKKAGVKVIFAEASLSKEGNILAEGQTYQAKNILISVGGQPFKPNIKGIEHSIDSDGVFQLQSQPRSIVIVGSGYIALEFAGIFHSIGTKVIITARKECVLNQFDLRTRDFFQEQMISKGLCFKNYFEASKIEKNKNGYIVHSTKGETVEGEIVLFATGRRPDIKSLGLKEAGVLLNEKGKITVDKDFKTSRDRIYAIGDCADISYELTPLALAEAELLVQKLFNKSIPPAYNFNTVPTAVFSNPPIATVGLTEEQAKKQDYTIVCFESQFRPLKYSINPENKKEKMYMKLIVDQKTDRVLGCHIVGEDAAEIIQGVAIAMTAGAKKSDFDSTIGLHPSSAEELCTLRTPRS